MRSAFAVNADHWHRTQFSVISSRVNRMLQTRDSVVQKLFFGRRWCLIWSMLISLPLSTTLISATPGANVEVTDIFGRVLNERGITLVDWEGYMANPAIKVFVRAPANVAFPATATVTASGPRLYFDLPSNTAPAGPSKSISFASADLKVPLLISIFPDRDSLDEDYTLSIRINTSGLETRVPIHVIDQDVIPDSAPPFNVTINFSQDKTGFFGDPAKQAIARQAAEDWAYYIGDMALDLVPAGSEQTFIWSQNGFVGGNFVANSAAYTGFLLYAYGIHSNELRSGGEPSSSGFQKHDGTPLPLRRSGGYEAETAGNYNSLGWFLTKSDDDWAVSGNLGNEPNDLYSIAHHEIGHALFFNPGHTLFGEFKSAGKIDVAPVIAYHGAPARINNVDHFDGEIDNASLRGAFGYEYYGSMPRKRWLITKLDLLDAQAIGYTLRPTSAFAPVTLQKQTLAAAIISAPYSVRLKAGGGLPFYFFEIMDGSLPAGLALNSFDGSISGTPTAAGTNSFTIRLRDYTTNSPGVLTAFTLTVTQASPAKFIPPLRRNSEGAFEGTLQSPPGQAEIIEASADFSTWLPVATNLSGNEVFDFVDQTSEALPFRFYRAKAK